MSHPFLLYRILNISSDWKSYHLNDLTAVSCGAADMFSLCWCFCRGGVRVHGDGWRRGQQNHRLWQLETGEFCRASCPNCWCVFCGGLIICVLLICISVLWIHGSDSNWRLCWQLWPFELWMRRFDPVVIYGRVKAWAELVKELLKNPNGAVEPACQSEPSIIRASAAFPCQHQPSSGWNLLMNQG